MVKCHEVVKKMEEWACPKYAEDWDNVGLISGDLNQPIKKVLATLDVTDAVIAEAIQEKADMIIAHHPMIFKPMSKIIAHDTLGAKIRKLIKNDIALYISHTNMDVTWGGLNDVVAEKMQLKNIKILDVLGKETYKKLVVFVPVGYEDAVREAMCQADAGCIGNYSACTYYTEGIGTFKPGDDTKAFIGEKGQLEKVKEYRLETIVPASKVKEVIVAMQKAHPYEEVAYDLYPLDLEKDIYGLGRVGQLEKETILKNVISQVKKILCVERVRYVGEMEKQIATVAICTGSGGSLISACVKHNADVFITGELKYHEAQIAYQKGLSVIEAGHFETEKIFTALVLSFLKNQFEDIIVFDSAKDRGFIKWA